MRGSESWEPQHQKLEKRSHTDRTAHLEKGVCGSHFLPLTASSHWPSPTVNPGKGFPGTEEAEMREENGVKMEADIGVQ